MLLRYDIRRFCPEVSANTSWVNERSHESYAKNYSIVFPHDEPLAARNQKKDPLHKVSYSSGTSVIYSPMSPPSLNKRLNS